MATPSEETPNPDTNDVSINMAKSFMSMMLGNPGIKGIAVVIDWQDPAVQSIGLWRTQHIDIKAISSLLKQDSRFHMHLIGMLDEIIAKASQETK